MALRKAVNRTLKLAGSDGSTHEEIEIAFDELLARFPDELDVGEIQFARLRAFSIHHSHPESAIDAAETAIVLLTNPLKRVQAYVWWGDSIQLRGGRKQGDELATARRESLVPYLAGIQEITELGVPLEKQDLPPRAPAGVFVFDDPDRERSFRALQARRRAAYKAAKLKNRLVDMRSILMKQILSMYAKRPFDLAELKEKSLEHISDEEIRQRLIDGVEERMDKRKRTQTLPGPPAPLLED